MGIMGICFLARDYLLLVAAGWVCYYPHQTPNLRLQLETLALSVVGMTAWTCSAELRVLRLCPQVLLKLENPVTEGVPFAFPWFQYQYRDGEDI